MTTSPDSSMRYVIFVDEDDYEVMYSAPVGDDEQEYIRSHIAPHLRPLSSDDYMRGPAVILHTLARFSYVLCDQELYWLTEWSPGLVAVQFSTDARIKWCALRSPIPNFGGREATEAEMNAYDEDAENYQYNLVFTPWDAQFDPQNREWHSFTPADKQTQEAFAAALAHVNALGEEMKARFAETFHAWAEECKANVAAWAAEGVRVE